MASEWKQWYVMRAELGNIDVHAEAVPLSFDIKSEDVNRDHHQWGMSET